MTDTIADMQLNANRTMTAYFKAIHLGDITRARAILETCVKTPFELSLFIEALSGFALACMHTAEAIGSVTGIGFDGSALLDDLTDKLAMAGSMDDALGDDHDPGTAG